ncbi:MAG: hypothetical protein R6V26_13405 [Roseovarius sp.]
MARARYGIAARAVCLAACLPLAACLASGEPEFPQKALRSVAFHDGAVTVGGPRGYCIDRASISRDAGGRFALLASCESLTGQPGITVAPAVMTVAVLPRGSAVAQPDATAMADALGPNAVLRTDEADGITLVQVANGGETVLPGGDPSHWRASMMINGHIVGLAAYGPNGGEIAGPRGRDLLRELAEALRAASAPDDGI